MKKIEAESIKWKNKYLVAIVKQTHRGDEFGFDGSSIFTHYVDGTSYALESLGAPSYSRIERKWYVRGCDLGGDEKILQMTPKEFHIFCKLIRAYNIYFSDESKDMPLETLKVERIQ